MAYGFVHLNPLAQAKGRVGAASWRQVVKDGAGACPVAGGGWEPRHTVEGDGSECTGVGGAVAAAGDAQVRGWGTEPKALVFHRSSGEGGRRWMA